MTDLEMTKLCAEAMGMREGYEYLEPLPDSQRAGCHEKKLSVNTGDGPSRYYDPLHDDAQAMALLKRFPKTIRELLLWSDFGGDLNRAIVECVAKMQAERAADSSKR